MDPKWIKADIGQNGYTEVDGESLVLASPEPNELFWFLHHFFLPCL